MAMTVNEVYELAKTWDEEMDGFLKNLDASALSGMEREFVEVATKRLNGRVLFGCESIASLMEEAVRSEKEKTK